MLKAFIQLLAVYLRTGKPGIFASCVTYPIVVYTYHLNLLLNLSFFLKAFLGFLFFAPPAIMLKHNPYFVAVWPFQKYYIVLK